MAKAPAKKPPTKTEIFASISEATGVAKKDVSAIFDCLSDEIAKALSKKGAQAFTIPGLCKIVVQHKPAQPAKNNANARRDHEQSSQATGSLCTCYFCTSCPLQPDLLNEGAACT